MKKLLLLKMALVIALMGGGSFDVWATDYYSTSTTDGVTTTEMHFNQYIYGAVARTGQQAFVLTSNYVTNADSRNAYVANDIIGDKNLYLFNYLAMESAYSMRHGSSTAIGAYSTGNDGIYTVTTDQYISIINLHPGDKVTVWNSGAVTFRSTNVTAEVSQGDAVVSETEYTIASGTQLDLRHYIKNKNHYIGVIRIVSQYDAVSNPVLTQTAAGTTSTIQITAGKCTNSGSTVTTYYTTDGTTPSAENNEGSFTTATHNVNITSNRTIKAISVTSGTYGGSSYVVSGDFTAEQATLAAPTASINGFTKDGDYYYPVYSFTSDQSGTIGYADETLTYTYSFNSDSPVEASSYTATSTAGTLRITVSADGFKSNYTDFEIAGTQYVSTYYLNVYKAIAEPLGNGGGGGGSTTINGTGCGFNTLAAAVFNGLTIAGSMDHAWASTGNYSHSIYKRGNGTGVVTYNGSFPAGSYIYYLNAEGSTYVVVSSNTISFPKFSGFRDLRVLVPSASAEAYSLASGTNLTNNGEFTSNVSGWDTAGTITKESDSSTSGSGFGWNSNGWAEMWADNNSASADYAHYNSDCYIAQRYVNMPAGDYYVSADLVANGGNVSVYTISVNGVAQKTENGDFENWMTKAHVINVPSDNSLITIKYAPQNGGRAWVGIDNVSCVFDPNPSVTVTAAGWATLYTAYPLDFSGVDGLTAYTATCDGSTVTLTKVNDIPANTGVVLRGSENTYNIPVIASSETDKGHLLGSATEATVFNAYDGYDIYMLALNGDNEAQFTKVTSGSIAAGKAYLQVEQSSGSNNARALSVVFADETTSISEKGIGNSDKFATAHYYDLQGRRVNQPTKGLYIKNGCKIVIK